MQRVLVASALTLFVAACARPSDVVVIEMCGDVEIPEDVDAVRISILDAERANYNDGMLELLRCPGDEIRELPQTVELDAPVGDVWIAVQGLQDGVEVLRSERRAVVSSRGAAPEVLVGLTRSCMRVTCPLGQTCIDGDCEQAPWESDESMCSGGRPSEGAGGGLEACPEVPEP